MDDEKLWKMAENRVGFRRHFFIYIVINLLILGLWYFTSYKEGNSAGYWFIYPLLGWGIGVAFHYWGAYHDDYSSIENEYKKIKEQYGISHPDKDKPDNE
jgi:hypothetical protein